MEKTIDEILEHLDDEVGNLKKSEEEIKRFSASSEEDLFSYNKRYEEQKRSSIFRVPVVKETYRHETYHTRYEYYINYIKNVDYSSSKSREDYVMGHVAALNKYVQQAEVNNRNLIIVEAILADEYKNSSLNKDTYYNRGYADGLRYCLGAINYSKVKIMGYVNTRLKEVL